MDEWVFQVVMKADTETSEQAEDKISNVLVSINQAVELENLTDQPYILSYENGDGTIRG